MSATNQQSKVISVVTMYDPPGGWKYGFPRPYLPLPGETLVETLRRDGYPQAEIDSGSYLHCRFWTRADD